LAASENGSQVPCTGDRLIERLAPLSFQQLRSDAQEDHEEPAAFADARKGGLTGYIIELMRPKQASTACHASSMRGVTASVRGMVVFVMALLSL
jgi:hypothetical protein